MIFEHGLVSDLEMIACCQRQKIYTVHEATEEIREHDLANALRLAERKNLAEYRNLEEILDAAIAAGPLADKRLIHRRSLLGFVNVTADSDPEANVFHAYCVNASARGLCVESPHVFDIGVRYCFQVMPFYESGKIVCHGTIVWARRILPDMMLYGVSFHI